MYKIKRSTLLDITTAIRGKTHRTQTILGSNIAKEINTIWAGVPNINTNGGVSPDSSNFDGAMAAVVAATTYWNAKASGTRAFAYQDGFGPMKPTNADGTGRLSDAYGAGVMDCSSYTGFVLRGIGYLNSPFAGITGANQSYDPKNVHATSDAWAETYFDKQPTNADVAYTADKYKTSDGYLRIVTASDIAAYYARMSLTFWPGERDVKPGDLCFFYKTNDDGTLVYPKRYFGISHVGLMISKDKFLNITSYPASGNLIVTNVTARAPFLYARPLYGSITRGASGDLTAGVTDLIPDVPSGIPQGTSNNNGLTITMTGKKMSLSGKPTSGMTKTFVSKSCPIELPPGTYKLSGFVNGTGTNTKNPNHSMWGLRVYNADTGDGIAGTTTSSNGASTADRTPVWDVGGGAMFTLTATTRIYINMWLTSSMALDGISANPTLYRV
nr:MAG TPA: cellulosome protein [Caudoviricetes sp.]